MTTLDRRLKSANGIVKGDNRAKTAKRRNQKAQRKLLGRYIVADPKICHGKPTFIGTRIMVWQILKQVARGMPWDEITAEWRGTVSKEAIAEAIALAERTFEDHAIEYAKEPQPA